MRTLNNSAQLPLLMLSLR